jgi:ABC-type antimicrobial peptide transport system permease subunit
MKWLKEEKAECPMCRFVLKSKELLCHENREENDDGYSDSDSESESDSDGDAIAPQHEQEPEPELNNYAARINNIVSRMAQSVAGRMNHTQRHLPVEYEESISIPINRLIENRRNLISQARNVAASRAMPSSGGGAAARARVSAESYANAHREVRAAPPAANNDPNNDPNNNSPILNIINNNYYYNNNNIINNYNDDEDVVSNQEQADIEEAIRRSLEHV